MVTVGRLDINTEGLLLLTNDGGLARMLELPKTGWLRRYRVRANGETDQAQLDALGAGIEIDGIEYAGIEAKLDRSQGANCWLTMGLREGKNREIKRVLEHLGLEVNRLIRLSFGPFQLLDLAEGAVEEVRTRVLKDQLGAALAAEAGVDFGEAPAPAATVEPARIVSDQAAACSQGRARQGRARHWTTRPACPRQASPRRRSPAAAEPRERTEKRRAPPAPSRGADLERRRGAVATAAPRLDAANHRGRRGALGTAQAHRADRHPRSPRPHRDGGTQGDGPAAGCEPLCRRQARPHRTVRRGASAEQRNA